MKSLALCLLFVCSVCASTLASEGINSVQPDFFLGEKIVLCAIDFLPNSYTLSEQEKTKLDRIVGQLELIDTTTKSIRIEGFLGVQDSVEELTALSMNRALAVEEYLRVHHNVGFERFLTGHKKFVSNCHAEIVVYDNPWNDSQDMPIQLASKGK